MVVLGVEEAFNEVFVAERVVLVVGRESESNAEVEENARDVDSMIVDESDGEVAVVNVSCEEVDVDGGVAVVTGIVSATTVPDPAAECVTFKYVLYNCEQSWLFKYASNAFTSSNLTSARKMDISKIRKIPVDYL